MSALLLAALLSAAPGAPAAPAKGAAPAQSKPAAPPVLTMLELNLRGRLGTMKVDKQIRLAHPKGWEGDVSEDGRAIQLYGPEGEGEMLIAALAHPSEIGEFLERLRKRHPGAAPSPPQFIDVRGIDNEKGERATRFEVTGMELGELVTIERGDVIVLFATIVAPNSWAKWKGALERCYPTITVYDRLSKKSYP